VAACDVNILRYDNSTPSRSQHELTRYGKSVEELNALDPSEAHAVFRFVVSGRHPITGVTSPIVHALGDTGANCNVASPATIAMWEQHGCLLATQSMDTSNIKLGGKTREALSPIVRRVKVFITFHLEGYDLHAEEWILEWADLSEPFILSYATLKRHYLLAYMQVHIAPMGMTSEEVILDELQAPPPRADDFAPYGTELSTTELETMLQDPSRINQKFPLLDQLKSILHKYGSRLFAPRDTHGLDVQPAEFFVKNNVEFPRAPCRFVGRHILPHLEFELNKLETVGIIRRIQGSASICCSPLCIAAKADGYIRIAVDYRAVNALLIGSALPIPLMHLLFDYFAGGLYYAGLDALDGYFQHPIAETSKYLTTFVTPFGLFEFNFLPMGMAPSPGIFSHTFNEIILKEVVHPRQPGLRAAVNFIDDTGVCGRSAEEFLDRLERVLHCFWRHNARLKFSKSTFGFESLEYCGHVFTVRGYHLSETRKQGIVDLMVPVTLKQTRAFLGMCQYFARFVPNMALLLAPITALTAQVPSKQFVFSASAVQAFMKVKEAIVAAGQLFHVEPDGDLILHTDASLTGIGGYLMQRIRGEEHAIAYVSHKFSLPASKWSTIEQEAYAIVYCVLKLETFLLGRPFLIRTDHRNLIFILGSTIPKVVRWRLRLFEYIFSIEHIAGVENVVADHLSRTHINTFQWTSNDSSTTRVSMENLFLQVHNSIVGHHGLRRTQDLLAVVCPTWRTDYDNAYKQLQQLLRHCVICQKIKGTAPLQKSPQDTWHHLHGLIPFLSISMDFWGPFPEDVFGNMYMCGIICNLNKIAMGVPTKSATALSAVMALAQWASIFGWCRYLRTDAGSHFTADVIRELMVFIGAEHVVVLPGHHQGNGIIERRFRETGKHIKAMLFNARTRNHWSICGSIAFGIANSNVDRNLNVSPSRMTFGPFANTMDNFTTRSRLLGAPPATVHAFIKDLDDITTAYVATSKAHLQRQVALEDARRIRMAEATEQLENGDYVLMEYETKHIPKPPTKLHPLLRGPLMVQDCRTRPDIITCLDLVTQRTVEVHIDRLRKFHAPDHILPHELLQWALADQQMEYVVEAVIGHRFRHSARRTTSTLELNIQWTGYDEATWEPYAMVKDVALVDEYVLRHKLPRLEEQ